MTVKELLTAYTDSVDVAKLSSLELEVLLAFALQKEKEYLLAHPEDVVDENLAELFKNYVERVIQGEPVAYITQNKEFYGLDFYVDKRVLVPRPETEGLVDRTISFFQMKQADSESFDVLEVGTGSGNIIISLVMECERIGLDVLGNVEAIELSEEALEVARMNAARHGVEDKIHFYQGDLLEGLEKGSSFNVILANLPYIGTEKNNFMEKNVKDHEPNVALFGGEDGLLLYEKMFAQLKQKNIGFDLMMGEFGFSQADDLKKILNHKFGGQVAIDQDYAGMDRFFVVKG